MNDDISYRYRVIELTPEQIEASKRDVGAFVRLRDTETQACLDALYKQLYPVSRIDQLAAQKPLWPTRARNKLRAWAWRVRAAVGRPFHWVANAISPHECEHDCC